MAGHQRIDALDAIEGTFDYVLRVAAVDLDEKTEKEQNIFMNNPDVQGTFDFAALEGLVKEIDLDAAGLEFADIYRAFGDTVVDNEHATELAQLSNRLQETKAIFESCAKKSNDRNDTDFYMVVVFQNHEKRKAFTDLVKAEDNRYIDGAMLTEILTLRQAQGSPQAGSNRPQKDVDAPEPAPDQPV